MALEPRIIAANKGQEAVLLRRNPTIPSDFEYWIAPIVVWKVWDSKEVSEMFAEPIFTMDLAQYRGYITVGILRGDGSVHNAKYGSFRSIEMFINRLTDL